MLEKHLIASLAVFACASMASAASAQQTTEQFLYGGAQTLGNGMLQGAGEKIGDLAVSWVASHVLHINPDGTISNTEEINEALERIKQLDDRFSSQIGELQQGLNSERMNLKKVHDLFQRTLDKVDHRLAEVERKVEEQQATLIEHEQIMKQFNSQIGDLYQKHENLKSETDRRFAGVSERQRQDEENFDTLARRFPHQSPEQQAEQMGVSGMKFLLKNDNQEAMKSFRFAHAYDPTEPGFLYMLAVTYRRAGQQEYADTLLAQGVAAERRRSLSDSAWWQNMIERFQGADRSWVDDTRHDAVYGVFAPGDVHVPDSLLVGK